MSKNGGCTCLKLLSVLVRSNLEQTSNNLNNEISIFFVILLLATSGWGVITPKLLGKYSLYVTRQFKCIFKRAFAGAYIPENLTA